MEVNLFARSGSEACRIANQRGRDAEAVVRDAIERIVNDDESFIGEVEKGLAQIERGEVLRMKRSARVSNSGWLETTPLMQLRWTEQAGSDREHIIDYLFELSGPCRGARANGLLTPSRPANIPKRGRHGKENGTCELVFLRSAL